MPDPAPCLQLLLKLLRADFLAFLHSSLRVFGLVHANELHTKTG